jgi:hypothetical protein
MAALQELAWYASYLVVIAQSGDNFRNLEKVIETVEAPSG